MLLRRNAEASLFFSVSMHMESAGLWRRWPIPAYRISLCVFTKKGNLARSQIPCRPSNFYFFIDKNPPVMGNFYPSLLEDRSCILPGRHELEIIIVLR